MSFFAAMLSPANMGPVKVRYFLGIAKTARPKLDATVPAYVLKPLDELISAVERWMDETETDSVQKGKPDERS